MTKLTPHSMLLMLTIWKYDNMRKLPRLLSFPCHERCHPSWMTGWQIARPTSSENKMKAKCIFSFTVFYLKSFLFSALWNALGCGRQPHRALPSLYSLTTFVAFKLWVGSLSWTTSLCFLCFSFRMDQLCPFHRARQTMYTLRSAQWIPSNHLAEA